MQQHFSKNIRRRKGSHKDYPIVINMHESAPNPGADFFCDTMNVDALFSASSITAKSPGSSKNTGIPRKTGYN